MDLTFNLDDIVRVVARFRYAATYDMQNVFHFLVTTAGSATQAAFEAALEAWLDEVYNSLVTHISESVDPYDIKVDKVVWNGLKNRFDISENLLFAPWTLTTNPSGSGESLPLQTSAVVNLRTDRPKTRGRKFLPVFNETNNNDAGGIPAAAQANMLLAISGMFNTLTPNTATLKPGIPSGYSGAHPHFFEFTSGTVTPRLCTQRRRRVGVGS